MSLKDLFDRKNPPSSPTPDEEEINALRYGVEFLVIPESLHASPGTFVPDLLERGAEVMRLCYFKAGGRCPFQPEEFAVTALPTLAGYEVIRVDMPQRHLRMPLCRRAYILYREDFGAVRYLTVEQSLGGDILGEMTPEGVHLNYGPATAEEELGRIGWIVGQALEKERRN